MSIKILKPILWNYKKVLSDDNGKLKVDKIQR